MRKAVIDRRTAETHVRVALTIEGRGRFDNRTGVLVVTGQPQARQGNNLIRGRQVTFTVGSERLEVDQADTEFVPQKGGLPKLPGRRP